MRFEEVYRKLEGTPSLGCLDTDQLHSKKRRLGQGKREGGFAGGEEKKVVTTSISSGKAAALGGGGKHGRKNKFSEERQLDQKTSRDLYGKRTASG